MVNLTIRLGKAGVGKQQQEHGGGKGPSLAAHLVDAELPLVKGVGTVIAEPCEVRLVGVKARRRPGDKVHVCVRCNFPIAVYGRLIPCEHVFCLTCAKLDPTCFLCKERVTRIQKMDVLEGIFICGAPDCLRSFPVKPDFDNHIADAHSKLLTLEHGRVSPERNVLVGYPASEAQAQSHQQHADPTRQASSTLQMILPKKEDAPERRPPKGVRQDPQARPVPELRLPDQFPRHHDHTNHNTNNIDTEPKRDRKPRKHIEWDTQSQGREPHRECHPNQQVVNALPPPPPYPPPNLYQEGDATFPRTFIAFNQNGYGRPQGAQLDQFRPFRPQFYPKYVVGIPRYHEGHLPPPPLHGPLPPGPPPLVPLKRAKFSKPYSWGPPNLGGPSPSFGGPPLSFGGPHNWMPPTSNL